MGLFDFFKRRPTPPIDLREALVQSAERQDWQTIAALCRQHKQEILTSFPIWRQVPESIRKDPASQNRYVQGLVAVAQHFEQAGDPSLIALLVGNQADNPVMVWEQDLAAAQAMIDDGRPGEAIEALQSALAKTAKLSGSGVDHYLPRTFGMLGVAYLHSGDRDKAVEFTQRAKELCERMGDEEGGTVYEGNLRHMQDSETVIFRGADGRTLTLEGVRHVTGTFQYEILGKTNVPAEAELLHKQARHAGGSGDYGKAITLLARASSLAPSWPYPVYDMAFTHLLMNDAENARKHYRKTVEMAPRGFFTAITALDSLEREAKGGLPAGTYLAYVSLEWVNDAGKKADAVSQLVNRVPGFAPAWKELAMQAGTDADKLAAVEKGLAANPDGETMGILLINKALILDRSGDHTGAVRLLGELALDPASTHATEHLAKVTLANVTQK